MIADKILQIPLDDLIAQPQVRRQFDEAAIDAMAGTFHDTDQLHPIRVRPGDRAGTYVITDGERRVRAAHRAGWRTIAAIVDEETTEAADVLVQQVVSNCQREDLTALEKADAIARYMELAAANATQAAAKLGFSNGTVTKLLSLRTLPDSIRQMVVSNHLTAGQAYELARETDPVQQLALAQQLASGELTRDGLVRARRRTTSTAETPGSPKPKRLTAVLDASRSVTVVSPEPTLDRFIDLLEDLLAKARKARTQRLELPTFLNILRDQQGQGP